MQLLIELSDGNVEVEINVIPKLWKVLPRTGMLKYALSRANHASKIDQCGNKCLKVIKL